MINHIGMNDCFGMFVGPPPATGLHNPSLSGTSPMLPNMPIFHLVLTPDERHNLLKLTANESGLFRKVYEASTTPVPPSYPISQSTQEWEWNKVARTHQWHGGEVGVVYTNRDSSKYGLPGVFRPVSIEERNKYPDRTYYFADGTPIPPTGKWFDERVSTGYHNLIGPHDGFSGQCRINYDGSLYVHINNGDQPSGAYLSSGMYFLPTEYLPPRPWSYKAGIDQWKVDFPDHAKKINL